MLVITDPCEHVLHIKCTHLVTVVSTSNSISASSKKQVLIS